MNNNNIPSLTVKVGGEFTIEKFKADGTVTHTSHHKNMILDQGIEYCLTTNVSTLNYSYFNVAMGGGDTPVQTTDTSLEGFLFNTATGAAGPRSQDEISPGVFKIQHGSIHTSAIGVLPNGGTIKELGLSLKNPNLLFTRAVLGTPVEIEPDEGVRVRYDTYSIIDSSIMDLGTLDGYEIKAAFRGPGLGGNTIGLSSHFPRPFYGSSPSTYASSNDIPSEPSQTLGSISNVGSSSSRSKIPNENKIRYTAGFGIGRTSSIKTLFSNTPRWSGSDDIQLIFSFTPAVPKTADNTFQFVYEVEFDRI